MFRISSMVALMVFTGAFGLALTFAAMVSAVDSDDGAASTARWSAPAVVTVHED